MTSDNGRTPPPEMIVQARWQGDLRFTHTGGGGHTLATDAPSDGAGPSPMELLLMGLAGCTGMDVASILQRMRQPLTGLSVTVRAERAANHPRVFTRIHLTYEVQGALDEGKVRQAVELSERTYCSASAMLGRTAAISHEIRILGDS